MKLEDYRQPDEENHEIYSNPSKVLDLVSKLIETGEPQGIPSLIATYVAHSPKYRDLDHFLEIVSITKEHFENMLMMTGGIEILFDCLEQVWMDTHKTYEGQEGE